MATRSRLLRAKGGSRLRTPALHAKRLATGIVFGAARKDGSLSVNVEENGESVEDKWKKAKGMPFQLTLTRVAPDNLNVLLHIAPVTRLPALAHV